MTARPLPELWREPIAEWHMRLQSDGFAAGTVRDRMRAVRRAAQALRDCPWAVTEEQLSAYVDSQEWSASTGATWLRTVRLFYEFAISRGWTDRNPTPPRRPLTRSAVGQWPVLEVPTAWGVEIAAWAAWLRSAGQSHGTVGQRTYHLRRFAVDHGGEPWSTTLEEIVGWLGGHDWSASTLRMHRNSLRAFFRWGLQTERIHRSPAADLPPVRAHQGVPRPAPEQVIHQALEAADDRLRLAIRLAATVGLRRAELARVHTRDVQHYPDGWRLRVLGKGGGVRVIPLPDDLGNALGQLSPGWAFPGQCDGHLSPEYVGKMVSRALGPGWTTHTLRHRFASRAYLAERDIIAVRDLLGHANVRTTQIYTAVPNGARRAAVAAAVL